MISEYEFPTVGQIAHAQELRGAEVVHVAAGGGRLDPAGALRRGDRRADRARLLHDRLVPHRPPARRRRDRAHRPRARARSASPTRTRRSARSTSTPARSASTSSPAARSSTCSPRRASASSTSARELLPELLPTPDRLVRRRGHLPDGHLRLLAGRRRPPLRRRHAAGAEHLRAASPACRSSRRPAPPRSRSTSPGSPTRLIDGARASSARVVVTPREPARRGPLVCVALDRRRARSSTRSPRRRSSARSATRTSASRSTSTTSRRTSTGCSTRSRENRSLLA